MNRLTTWNDRLQRYTLPQGAWREIAERLAAYENTGLEPEEIEALKARKRGKATPAQRDEVYTATIILHSDKGNVPWVDPTNDNAYLHVAELYTNADNPQVLKQRGINHLVISVYEDHWHITQVCGYTPEHGLYCKLY